MINWHKQDVCAVKEISVLNWQLREGFKECGPVDGSLESALEDVTDFADVTLVCDYDSQNESRKSPGLFPWIAGCQSNSM